MRDLTPARESLSVDVEGQPTLFWTGPAVAPMAVAAIFQLFGAIAVIEHPGLAPLRISDIRSRYGSAISRLPGPGALPHAESTYGTVPLPYLSGTPRRLDFGLFPHHRAGGCTQFKKRSSTWRANSARQPAGAPTALLRAVPHAVILGHR